MIDLIIQDLTPIPEVSMITILLIVILFVLVVGVGACLSRKGFVVTVEPLASSTQYGPVQGIPFYKKIPVFVQTSIYLDPFYEVKLYVGEGEAGKAVKPVLIFRAVSLIKESDLSRCNVFLNTEKFSSSGEVIAAFKNNVPDTYCIKGVNDFKGISQGSLPTLYSNTVDSKMVIDWKSLYYINYKVPIAGSSSLTAELSADGTLTKAVGQTEDKTLETMIGAVSTFLPKKDDLTKSVKTQAAIRPIIFLEIEKKACKYTLTKIHDKRAEAYPEIEFADKSASMTLEVIGSGTTSKEDKKDAARNAIEFSGQVKLPAEE